METVVLRNSDWRLPHEMFLWHPFGDHGDEKESEIIVRKSGEIQATGYTYWTIGMQKGNRLLSRIREHLSGQSKGGPAFVVLGANSRKTKNETPDVATHFNENLEPMGLHRGWTEIPYTIEASRKDLRSKMSAALVVDDIVRVEEECQLEVEWWYQKKGNWSTDSPKQHMRDNVKLLRKKDGGSPIRSGFIDCRYILRLKYPYIVMVKTIP